MHDEAPESTALPGLMRRWSRWLDRRQHPRVLDVPLVLRINGRAYKTADWSIGGARIAGYSTALAPGDLLSGTIDPIGDEKRGAFIAEVIRRDEQGQLGLRFIEISAMTLLAMEGQR